MTSEKFFDVNECQMYCYQLCKMFSSQLTTIPCSHALCPMAPNRSSDSLKASKLGSFESTSTNYIVAGLLWNKYSTQSLYSICTAQDFEINWSSQTPCSFCLFSLGCCDRANETPTNLNFGVLIVIKICRISHEGHKYI